MMHEAKRWPSTPERTEIRDPVLRINDQIGPFEPSNAHPRDLQILGVRTTCLDNFVFSFAHRSATDKRDVVPSGSQALEQVIDDDLRATRRWMCQVPPIEGNDFQAGCTLAAEPLPFA